MSLYAGWARKGCRLASSPIITPMAREPTCPAMGNPSRRAWRMSARVRRQSPGS